MYNRHLCKFKEKEEVREIKLPYGRSGRRKEMLAQIVLRVGVRTDPHFFVGIGSYFLVENLDKFFLELRDAQ